MSQIIVFWSNRGIKILLNVVFRLNREIVKKTRKIKMPRRFFALEDLNMQVSGYVYL